jgi:Cd2+/Zn2+-exporting ATPase
MMTKKQKKMLLRICVAAVLMAVARLLNLSGILGAVLYLVPYFILSWDVLWRAARNIAHGQVFDENFLMSVASIGALCLGDYLEADAVMLLYQIGELFQSYAVGRSRQSIASLMDIRPDYANIERDGQLVQVDPDEVAVGDVIVVQPGEKIPLDGTVLEGRSTLDTAALTGESAPREIAPGQEVLSGCVNLNGLLRIQVTKPFGESTVSKILELVENAASKKAKAENFITRFAQWYTPCVVIGAVLLAVIPPLVLHGGWVTWITRALTFLVISCPCALVISVPLSFFGGIGGAARNGILIKGGSYLEALGSTDTIVFDKTGTLTQGIFAVTQTTPVEGVSEQRLLELAALAESHSNHPIATSLKTAWGGPVELARVSDVEEVPGHGVRAVVDGTQVAAGNAKLMAKLGIQAPAPTAVGTVVYVAADGVYQGCIVIADVCKPDAKAAIARLKALGVRRTVMLTGDALPVAEDIAAQLGIDEVHAELLPADKVALVEQLFTQVPAGKKLAFVGDGVNDAPVLSRADIGIAMGAMGSDAAIEAADVVLMDDAPGKIATAVSISRKTMGIVHQNIVFALSVKALFLLLGALGFVGMWGAVFADVGVAIIAILNAMRALRVQPAHSSQ